MDNLVMPSEKEIINKIAEAYRLQIKIPGKKPEKQFFLCPVGLIGSGKTTVLEILSEKLSLVRVSGDEIRKILKEKEYSLDLTWEIGQKVVVDLARQGYSIAHDTDCATLKTQEYLKELAGELGAKIIWIHIDTPEKVILERMKTPRKSWLFETVEAEMENYYARKPLHQNLAIPFTYTFDTSKDNFNEQIKEGLLAIESAL